VPLAPAADAQTIEPVQTLEVPAAPAADLSAAPTAEPPAQPLPRFESMSDTATASVETESVLAKLKLDWPGDLVQIETDPQKVRPMEAQEAEAPRPRRVRRPPPPVSDEPLIQVETRKREIAMDSAPLQQA